ncbi:MAG: NgoPII family restriction endonuclease [Bacteroidales bacterium]|nr:NgoPII family restriction endonuclease [Bacteroidales bacterium]
MTNILEAIINIVNNPDFEIKNRYSGRNRINNIGEALEIFIKDAFANTLILEKESDILNVYNEEFSWLGNQNHPPDIIIRNGDAIEVKKTQSQNSDLALNSSYPKSTIQSNSTLITKECRECENWTEKDIIYCIGHTSDISINSLWMVYGSIYAAKHEIYQRIKQKITEGISEIPNIELAETNELGRVNRVDPLGITNLRIRGMWQIQNPRKVFRYLFNEEDNNNLVAIIPKYKYDSFPKESKDKIEKLIDSRLTITDQKVKNPNNPVELIEVKLIVFKIE